MERIKELDFLKCMLIILMVAFHLVYIGDMWSTNPNLTAFQSLYCLDCCFMRSAVVPCCHSAMPYIT